MYSLEYYDRKIKKNQKVQSAVKAISLLLFGACPFGLIFTPRPVVALLILLAAVLLLAFYFALDLVGNRLEYAQGCLVRQNRRDYLIQHLRD